jgi:hypothetical protein
VSTGVVLGVLGESVPQLGGNHLTGKPLARAFGPARQSEVKIPEAGR